MSTLEEVAAGLQGYDPEDLRADAATTFLRALATPVEQTETLPLKAALGRVLAADVVSPINVPAHDNSAMDGYVFRGASLVPDQALSLDVVGTALAGKAWTGLLADGQCLRIMTGAVMPTGLDTVVPQELVQLQKQADGQRITIPANSVRQGANCRHKGEDLQQGKPALLAGSKLGPAALGLLASLNLGQVEVRRKLRVAFFSTGDEILSLGEPAREGAVYDSNRYTLFGLLTRLDVEVLDLGVVRDAPDALETAFRQASEQADVIITSGGVSVGEADHTKAVMQKMGDVAFWKIAIRPGRPMAVGRIGPALLFGLPGNPVAVMVTFLAFVRPALLQMMGLEAQTTPMLKAHSLEVLRKKPGRTEFQRAIVQTDDGGKLQVRTTGQQGSGVLSSMAAANGLIVLRHERGAVAIGEEVDVLMFDGLI